MSEATAPEPARGHDHALERRILDERGPLIAALVALSVLAWVTLWFWSRSPYAGFLDHQVLEHTGLLSVLSALFVLGWVLMTVAMMLPTSLPLVALFHSMTRNRADHGVLVALLIAGYLGVWTAFGVVIHQGDWFLHRIVHAVPWLHAHPWIVGAAIFATAGAFQFSRMKYRCLDQCRSPYSFIAGHWRGGNERWQALRLGVHHGLFCLGCCWALMLLMFALGAGNIGWMLAIGVVMAVEKNVSWGRRIGRPLGAVLLVTSVAVAASGVPLS